MPITERALGTDAQSLAEANWHGLSRLSDRSTRAIDEDDLDDSDSVHCL
jgi:hypothetical protein